MDRGQDYRAPDGASTRYQLSGAPEGLGSLITGIIKDLQDLMRAEVQLAKTELKDDASAAGKAIAYIAAGALIGLVGFIFLMLAITYLLDKWVDRWVGAAIVGAVLAIIAAILALSGKNKLSASSMKPDQMIDSLKEDQQWAKQQINSVKR